MATTEPGAPVEVAMTLSGYRAWAEFCRSESLRLFKAAQAAPNEGDAADYVELARSAREQKDLWLRLADRLEARGNA
ncbi:MAG TPA: hypothetical protein VFH61_08415 [Thermoleophilia bacterium]|nr:hypothetical protein [Thermoleophilia bacterium]